MLVGGGLMVAGEGGSVRFDPNAAPPRVYRAWGMGLGILVYYNINYCRRTEFTKNFLQNFAIPPKAHIGLYRAI